MLRLFAFLSFASLLPALQPKTVNHSISTRWSYTFLT